MSFRDTLTRRYYVCYGLLPELRLFKGFRARARALVGAGMLLAAGVSIDGRRGVGAAGPAGADVVSPAL